ncbi:MAG: glycoside hydrolase family 18 protein [Candidatus Latescibacteria bacterium]|nr:glycoside hydrolase family 18 protein [Candidatus Latescibacterota bacterium]
MKLKYMLFLIMLCFSFWSIDILSGIDTTSAEQIVLGYYPAWVKESYPATAVNFSILTHIIHAFAWPEADGSISLWEGFEYPGLIDEVHKSDRKILVALGGWGNCEGFPPVAADPKIRARFVTNIMEFCAKHGYDGIDLDWEFPANPVERDNLTRLVSNLRVAADKLGKPFLITMAISAGTWSGDHNDYAALKDKIDWFNDMTYDFYGNWTERAGHNSPLYATQESVDTSINFLVKRMGVPPDKIIMGLPFYGRTFNTSSLYGLKTGGDGIVYKEIVKKIDDGWQRQWDDVSMVPYLVNPAKNTMIFYDDPESIKIKCNYAREKNLRGVMIWSIGSDYINGRQPLLESIGDSLR